MMRFPIYGKIKNVPTHQPVHVFWFLYLLVNAPIHQALTNRIHTASRCSLKPRPMLPMLAQATYSNLFPEVFPSSNPQFGGFKPNKNLRENPRVCPIIIVTINTPQKSAWNVVDLFNLGVPKLSGATAIRGWDHIHLCLVQCGTPFFNNSNNYGLWYFEL